MLDVDAAREADYAATCDLFNGCAELRLSGVLEHHADVAQPLVFPHLSRLFSTGVSELVRMEMMVSEPA